MEKVRVGCLPYSLFDIRRNCMSIELVNVNNEYGDYLRENDPLVPYLSDEKRILQDKKYTPWIGVPFKYKKVLELIF